MAEKTERKTEGRSHWVKGSMRMPSFFARFLLFLGERTGWAKDLLCVEEKAERRACAPFWCRLVLTGESFSQ